jgi:hypothetical protein
MCGHIVLSPWFELVAHDSHIAEHMDVIKQHGCVEHNNAC